MGAAARGVLAAVQEARRPHRDQRHARAGVAIARAWDGPGQRPPHQRAHGALRRVRADRHEGRRRETEVRRPTARAEDGHDRARHGARSVQAAARAWVDGRRRARLREHWPVRSLRSLCEQVRLDQGRRSVHDHVRACARADCREEDRGRESPDPRLPRGRHPSAERPLRARTSRTRSRTPRSRRKRRRRSSRSRNARRCSPRPPSAAAAA